MSDLRDQFEAVYTQKYEQETGHTFSTPISELREDAHYGADRTYLNAAWEWWQESRAALVVELPETPNRGIGYGLFEAGKDACREAIEAAGIKVTP
ncbi:hypothetical protein [Stutzerimonas nitrititolerans]|uniref:hypothetical protein n=1 Tax=Stutzerimonas nitrititolerans TaxID=2482751 RepID=UPI0028A766B0|nr:hypothetical protein [Stutzerimonas nitrititolerans]